MVSRFPIQSCGALAAVAADAESKCIAHGRHWELARYEWRPNGTASFAYVHRFTGKRVELERRQPFYAEGRRGR